MKLLRKTVRGYLYYSVFVLLVAIPAFYIIIQHVLQNETDEELVATKTKLVPRLEKILANTVAINFADDNTQIIPSGAIRSVDSLYTVHEYDTTEKEIIPYRYLKASIIIKGQHYLLTRKRSLLENDDLLKSILFIQVSLLVLLLTGLIIINRNLSKNIWHSFYNTLEKLRGFRVEADSTLNLPEAQVDEFNDLNKSLESLVYRTHQSFTTQKEFTENASHEMQTPLAVLQGKLELLMQTLPLTEEQANLIDEVADASERMTRLNKSLILLTKIENNQFQQTEAVSVKKSVEYFIRQYEAQISQKRIRLSFLPACDIILSGNRMLIEIMLGNMIGNAFRHNVKEGTIDIVLEQNKLIIRNSGQPESLDRDKIFNRFQKQMTDSNSLGLGLQIVRKICDLYGYKVDYQFAQPLHQFSVEFK